ncbi:cytochrome P450 [Lipomyces kononenkoae]|uniref:Cytochrome P450 n=1 Tax=Lipomyces kononenkoae TaxID=34357 RepID=A0ACC3SYG8_LIPKO
MAEKYPDKPFTRFFGLFRKDTVTLLTPEAHKFVLQTRAYDFPRPSLSMAYKIIIGDGIVFAEGDVHKYQRRLMSPAFSTAKVKSFLPIFVSKTVKVMHQFDKLVNAGPAVFKILPYFARLTLDAIGEASFGIDLNSIEDDQSELVLAYESIVTAGESPFEFLSFAFIPGWKYIPTAYNTSVRNSHKIFDATCQRIFNEKLAQFSGTGAVNDKVGEISKTKDRDILSLLVKTNDLTVEQIKNQIMTILFAGHETTAGLISWSIFTLAKHMEVQEKLRAEVRAVFPDGLEQIDNSEKVDSLKYLNNVVRELLRINPPVISTSREASKDVVVDGQTIYKGTDINISIKGLNYSKKLWGPDAYEFDPDRWNGRQADNAYAYLTFLQGPRVCLGKQFAELEFKYVLASFVARYKFEESVENQPINRKFMVTVMPTDGLPLKVSKPE